MLVFVMRVELELGKLLGLLPGVGKLHPLEMLAFWSHVF